MCRSTAESARGEYPVRREMSLNGATGGSSLGAAVGRLLKREDLRMERFRIERRLAKAHGGGGIGLSVRPRRRWR